MLDNKTHNICDRLIFICMLIVYRDWWFKLRDIIFFRGWHFLQDNEISKNTNLPSSFNLFWWTNTSLGLATKFPGKTNWKNLIVFLAINSQETEDFQMLIFLLQPSNPEKFPKFSTYTKKGLKVWFFNILSENMAFYKQNCHWYWNISCLIKHAIKARHKVCPLNQPNLQPLTALFYLTLWEILRNVSSSDLQKALN